MKNPTDEQIDEFIVELRPEEHSWSRGTTYGVTGTLRNGSAVMSKFCPTPLEALVNFNDIVAEVLEAMP